MKKKEFYFISRFSNDFLRKKLNQESNLSLSKKVLGICSLVSTSGYEINIIVTNTGNLRKFQNTSFIGGQNKGNKPKKF